MLIVGPTAGLCAYAETRLCSDGADELTPLLIGDTMDHPHNQLLLPQIFYQHSVITSVS